MNSIENTFHLCRLAFMIPQVDSGNLIKVNTWVDLNMSNDLVEIVDTHISHHSDGKPSYDHHWA